MIEQGYGRVLTRPGLSGPARELVAVTVLAAGGWERQLVSHLLGASRLGAPRAAIRRAFEAGARAGGPQAAAAARAWQTAFTGNPRARLKGACACARCAAAHARRAAAARPPRCCCTPAGAAAARLAANRAVAVDPLHEQPLTCVVNMNSVCRVPSRRAALRAPSARRRFPAW
jgi:hypothetical protein